jgi:hypothetical protein
MSLTRQYSFGCTAWQSFRSQFSAIKGEWQATRSRSLKASDPNGPANRISEGNALSMENAP